MSKTTLIAAVVILTLSASRACAQASGSDVTIDSVTATETPAGSGNYNLVMKATYKLGTTDTWGSFQAYFTDPNNNIVPVWVSFIPPAAGNSTVLTATASTRITGNWKASAGMQYTEKNGTVGLISKSKPFTVP